MEDFLRMKWTISGPHELEHGPEFIPEERVSGSYVFAHLDGGLEIRKCEEIAAKSRKKAPLKITAPGVNYNFMCRRKSRLSVMQQQNCLSALEFLQSGKKTLSAQNDMRLYNNLKRIIMDENATFLEYAKQHFNVEKSKVPSGNCKYAKWAERAWKEDLSRRLDYAQFYMDTEMLPYSYTDTDVPIEMLHVANVLELGSVAKFNPPSLIHSYKLSSNSLPAREDQTFNSKSPVSRDVNIDALLRANSVDIVMSSSALKKLMDFTNLDCSWCIPVIIKKLPGKESSSDWRVPKTVFLDKPLRKLKLSTEDLHEYCVKKLLRAKFCSIKAFSFQNEELPITINEDISKNTHTTENSQCYAVYSGNEIVGEKMEPEPNANHNVSYRIWNLQQQEEQSSLSKKKHKLKEIKIMIRCKLDGCEVSDGCKLQPLTVSPKLEYQLEYGGSIPTKTELVKEWTSTYIKPCSQLCRVRTHFKSGEVILIEHCNVQKISSEAQTHHEYKPRLGLGVLYKMFLELMNHEPGNYLLLHLPKHGPFVSLLKETNQYSTTAFDLHSEYHERNLEVIPRLQRNWCPLDVNLILPRHRISREMPGMFKPMKNKFKNNKLKRYKKKRKRTNVNVCLSVKDSNVPFSQ